MNNDKCLNEPIDSLFNDIRLLISSRKTALTSIKLLNDNNINTVGALLEKNISDLINIKGLTKKHVAIICYATKQKNVYFNDFANSKYFENLQLAKYLEEIDKELTKHYKMLCVALDSADAICTVGDGVEKFFSGVDEIISVFQPISDIAKIVDDVSDVSGNGRPIEDSIYKGTVKVAEKVATSKVETKKNFAENVVISSANLSNNKQVYNYKDLPTVPCQKGQEDNKTVIVLSAPGSLEEKNGAPAQGETGKNLSEFVKAGHKKNKNIFPSPNLKDYTIINASEHVHYKSKTGDTEAKKAELYDEDNINRLKQQTKNMNNILCFGDKATDVMTSINSDQKNLYSFDHPSNQKLNRKYKNDMFDDDLTPKERQQIRVELWAEDSLKNMTNKILNQKNEY